MIEIYNTILYQPLLNLLVWLYNVIPGNDIGVAIILLTIFIKLLLYPFAAQSLRSQKGLQKLQPKIEELKKKHGGNREALSKDMMALYKAEKVNPFSSCLPLLIQFPFLIAVYQVFRAGLSNGSLDSLYSFVVNPGMINPISFGIIDLAVPSIPLALLAGAAQYWQAKMMISKQQPKVPGSGDERGLANMNKQMIYFMPLITVFIGATFPGGLALYWLAMTLLTGLQQKFMFRTKKVDKKDPDSDVKTGEVVSAQSN